MEEIKEVELRFRRGKFIYNRTYNSIGLNPVSHFSQRTHARSRLPMNKLKSLLQKTRKVTLFVWKSIGKVHHYRLKFIVTLKIGLHLNRYRSNCNSVRFLLGATPKLVRKQGKVYLSSKHQSTGDLGRMRYPNSNTLLLKNFPLCTCNFPFYNAYNSLNHRLNLANLSFVLISRRIQDLQFM